MRPLGGGYLWGLDNLEVRGSIEATFSDEVIAKLATSTVCPTCGYNNFTRSALDPSCPTCGGSGLVITWVDAHLTCRFNWVDPAELHPHSGLVAGEIGDAQIQGRLIDKAIYERVMEEELSYLLYGGKRLKPKSVVINRIERGTSLDVRLYVISTGGVRQDGY